MAEGDEREVVGEGKENGGRSPDKKKAKKSKEVKPVTVAQVSAQQQSVYNLLVRAFTKPRTELARNPGMLEDANARFLAADLLDNLDQLRGLNLTYASWERPEDKYVFRFLREEGQALAGSKWTYMGHLRSLLTPTACNTHEWRLDQSDPPKLLCAEAEREAVRNVLTFASPWDGSVAKLPVEACLAAALAPAAAVAPAAAAAAAAGPSAVEAEATAVEEGGELAAAAGEREAPPTAAKRAAAPCGLLSLPSLAPAAASTPVTSRKPNGSKKRAADAKTDERIGELAGRLVFKAYVEDDELKIFFFACVDSKVRLYVRKEEQTVEVWVKYKQPKDMKNLCSDPTAVWQNDPSSLFAHHGGGVFAPGSAVTTGVLSLSALPDNRRLSPCYYTESSNFLEYTEKDLVSSRRLSGMPDRCGSCKAVLLAPTACFCHACGQAVGQPVSQAVEPSGPGGRAANDAAGQAAKAAPAGNWRQLCVKVCLAASDEGASNPTKNATSSEASQEDR